MTYSDKLQDPRWQKKRLQVLNRDNFTCLYCGDEKTTLHIHHLSYKNNPWDAELEELQTTCKFCHKAIETSKSCDPDVKLYSASRLEEKTHNILRLACYGEDTEGVSVLIVFGFLVDTMYCERVFSIPQNSLENLLAFVNEEKAKRIKSLENGSNQDNKTGALE